MLLTKSSRRNVLALGGAALTLAMSPSPGAASPRRGPATISTVELTGRVILPRDAEYEEARLTFNTRFSHFPAAIVECGTVADVQNAIRWARKREMPLRARSGGHSYEAFSVVDEGLVIDVSGLNTIEVDLTRGEAVVGAGVRLLDLYTRLWEDGMAIPLGTCPIVGIAGLTLGGGIGYLSRQYGLTCDNLVQVEMVDAEGEIVTASEDENADLFWALRGGGGGNFGIATSFTFRLHPVAEVVRHRMRWPLALQAEALDAWQRWAPFTDERLSAGFAVFDPSVDHVSLSIQFNGPADELPALVEPMRQVGPRILDEAETMSYFSAVELYAGQPVSHSAFKNTGVFVSEPWSAEAITTFFEQMGASPSTSNVVGFFPAGGAVTAIEPDATAYVHRDALFDVQYQAYWQDGADEEADVAWVRTIRDAMLPYTSGAYVNYIDADIADWATAYYGANLPRLMAIKAAYDPDNVFNGPQSIPLE